MAIQQKLQTKLAQKLILTPSLQQAIKLLPMSTLELADLLNQEIVENPLLEEIPTEDLQAVEPQAAEKEEAKVEPKNDTWDDQDYEYFFGEYLDDGYRPKAPTEVKELPPIENTLSTSNSLTDHLSWQLSIQTSCCATSARRSSATSTTTVTWWRPWTSSRAWAPGTSPMSSARSSCCRDSTPSGCARAICRSA
jgi:DNA-directed RNA polymerase specialized sigma54-like protein